MKRSSRARWVNAAAFGVLSVVQLLTSQPSLFSRWILPGALLALAVWLSPLFKGSNDNISHAEAERLLANASPGQKPVIVYHRPGCTFCGRLKLALTGVKDKAQWVDIWEDADAAAYVRSVNNGNETVPTVVIDGVAHTNPPPSEVREALVA